MVVSTKRGFNRVLIKVADRCCKSCGKVIAAVGWLRFRCFYIKAKYCDRACADRGRGFNRRQRTMRTKETFRNYNRRATWKYRKLRITEEEYQRMSKKQKGLCAICRKKPRERRLSVDHNHKTGAVRKLLCRGCNGMLGWYEANAAQIRWYLKEAAYSLLDSAN